MFKLNTPKLEKMLGDKFAAFKKVFDFEEVEHKEVVFVKLADGSGEINGTIEVGQAVTMKSADGSELPLSDGEYAIEGGKSITVMSGVISEISTTQEESQDGEMMSTEKIQELIQTSLTAQANEFKKVTDTLNQTITELKEANKDSFKAVVEAMELMTEIKAPAPEPKADPKNAYAQKRAEAFQKFLQEKEKINKK